MTLQYFLKQPGAGVEISALEAFGHHVNKISLYDLFSEEASPQEWEKKKGRTMADHKKIIRRKPKDDEDALNLIIEAHGNSHFAPTGKNPESSRGHITFIVRVIQRPNPAETLESFFLIVDLAGSEGESAFTAAFRRRVDPSTLMARRLEAGVINTGLSQLQIIFNELKVKGKLSKMVGTGLRQILHPYVNSRCVLSVLFCLSPSSVNDKATGSTLKFAVQAGMVSVNPVKEKKRVNSDVLVAGLKQTIEELQHDITEKEERVKELEEEIQKGGNSDHKSHDRKRTELPDDIYKLLGKHHENLSDEDMDKALPESQIAQIDTLALEDQMSEAILRQNSLTINDSQAVKSALQMGGSSEVKFRRQLSADLSGEVKLDEEDDMEEMEMDIDKLLEDIEGLNPEDLIDRTDTLESILAHENTMHESYLYSQQVMIDHLSSTNEGLLQFFRIK